MEASTGGYTWHLNVRLGNLVGQKAPLRLSEIRSIRVRLELAGNTRDLALLRLAID